MKYVEEKSFAIHFALQCEFPDDYDGDQDGYAWVNDWPSVAAEIVQAVTTVIRRRPDWRVRAGNRGRPSDEEVLLIVERALAATSPSPQK